MFARLCLGLAAALCLHASAQADTLPANGQWASFDVAYDLSGHLGWIDLNSGSSLSFSFTVPAGASAELTVVDAGFAGDAFTVLNNNLTLGVSPAVTNGYPDSIGLDFDAALANPAYSSVVFSLLPGSYSISGELLRSATDELGEPLNSTVGGIRLVVSAVPEPGTVGALLAGLGLLAALRRRQDR